MSRYYLCSIISLTIAVGALLGCTDECERAGDCLRDEVCFDGSCEPALSSAATCQSNADCNGGVAQQDDPPRICVSGGCIINPGAVDQQCNVLPLCFNRGEASLMLTPQTMTATTGNTVQDPDQAAPMSAVVAIDLVGTPRLNIVGTNATTMPQRQMCIVLEPASSSCERIQISVGDPAAAGTDIYETTNCTANLASIMGDIEGNVSGRVENCAGDSFNAAAEFDVAIQ